MIEVFTKPELAKAEDRCREYAQTAGWAAGDTQTVLNGLSFYRSLAISLACEVERLRTDSHALTLPTAVPQSDEELEAKSRSHPSVILHHSKLARGLRARTKKTSARASTPREQWGGFRRMGGNRV